MKTLKELGISPTPWVFTPWVFRLSYYRLLTPSVYRIYDTERKTIATVPRDEINEERSMEMNHNANLMAAAPELYTALTTLVAFVQNPLTSTEDMSSAVDTAKKAIEKAGGGQ